MESNIVFQLKSKNLKDLALLTLSNNSNLTAKQMYHSIKNKSNISFSF